MPGDTEEAARAVPSFLHGHTDPKTLPQAVIDATPPQMLGYVAVAYLAGVEVGRAAGVPAPSPEPPAETFVCGGFNCPINDNRPCRDPKCPHYAPAEVREDDPDAH